MNDLPTRADFQKIWPYSPHRKPMIWIDEVLEFGAKAGACLVRIQKDAHYMSRSGLRSSSCIEFIGQAYGYLSIAYRVYVSEPNAQPLRRAYLASVKNATFGSPDLMYSIKHGDELIVKIFGIRQIGTINSFSGQVACGPKILCQAQLNVFSEF